MPDTTNVTQCIECTRHAAGAVQWFYINGWGPICGFCWFRLTGEKDAPKAVSNTVGTR